VRARRKTTAGWHPGFELSAFPLRLVGVPACLRCGTLVLRGRDVRPCSGQCGWLDAWDKSGQAAWLIMPHCGATAVHLAWMTRPSGPAGPWRL
jgi:hypothetical protein